MLNDISRVIEQVSRDRGIDKDILVATLTEAIQSAAHKKLGPRAEIEVHYNEEAGEIEVFQFKEVVENVLEPDLEISIEQGRELDPECEIGDQLGSKMDTATFGRIAAQSAKQVIIQKMKDAERDAVYRNFIDRKGEIINGVVQRMDRGDIIVNLGQTEGMLPHREQVPREIYHRGDRIRAIILDVVAEGRGPQVILSRSRRSFLIQLFKMEVPEVGEGIVSIMGVAREPGVRSKVAVASSDSEVDAVGACVGMRGSRVQNVVHELRGEKIDIVPWHADSAKYVCNALAPAQISRVIIDDESSAMEVIVPDEFLSVAIGKKGQNVRLASKLTGWHLDVKSETRYNRAMQDGYDSLLELPGMNVALADALYEKGLYSVEEIASASPDDIIAVRPMDEQEARDLIDAARTAALKRIAEARRQEQEKQAQEAEARAKSREAKKAQDEATQEQESEEQQAQDGDQQAQGEDQQAQGEDQQAQDGEQQEGQAAESSEHEEESGNTQDDDDLDNTPDRQEPVT